jgi:hypothetical protein
MHRRCELVAFDVDGTLLTSDHRLTSTTRVALRKLLERGIVVVLASSRGPSGLLPVVAHLDGPTWAIAYQGAYVTRIGSAQPALWDRPVAPDDAGRVLTLAARLDVTVCWYSGNDWFVTDVGDAVLRESAITGERPKATSDPRTSAPAPHKIMLIAPDDEAIALLTQLSTQLPDGVHAAFSHRNYLEITNREADKGAALRLLAGHMRIPLDATAAVGDGDNDRALFAVAGYRIAMANAVPSLRRLADHITGSNDDGGVAAAIDVLLAGGGSVGSARRSL